MKITLIILGTLGLAFVVVQHYLKYNTNSVETQPYEVLETKEAFELRFYPSVNVARITSQSTSYNDMSSNGFRQLAGYIFGGNDKNESIAMTSPVQVDVDDSISTMSFMMPKMYGIDDLLRLRIAVFSCSKRMKSTSQLSPLVALQMMLKSKKTQTSSPSC